MRCDAMRCNWISFLGGKEDEVFFFIYFSSLSFYLHPRINHSMPFSSRAMHYYTWIRIIKKKKSRAAETRSKEANQARRIRKSTILDFTFTLLY